MMKLTLPSQSRLHSKEFTFGVATSSYQIEGGIESRLPCNWDAFCEQANTVVDKSNGDVACDHIHRWEEDIELIASLGVDAYRFSIAWGRVIHLDGSLNTTGVEFYQNILNRLKEKNIKAYVTLYHWDLPLHLEEAGGWLNRDTIYKFEDYVDKITRALGNDVFCYTTLNEPFCSAYLGYEIGVHAPGISDLASGRRAAHHLLLAHGLAMKVLRKNCPASLSGIVLNMSPCYAGSSAEADVAAAKLADDLLFQWYAQPLLEGRYPDAISSLPESARPPIEEGDMALIQQPLDYLGLNYYTRAVCFSHPEKGFVEQVPEGVELTDMGWEVYPQGLTDLLVGLHQRYPALPPLLITENGAAMVDEIINGEVNDISRIQYFQSHLTAVHNAIENGVDVQGYFAWSLMDNFEWALGYSKRFGITYVDYETQKRTLKASGHAFSEFVSSRG